jgi:hypothetical protein
MKSFLMWKIIWQTYNPHSLECASVFVKTSSFVKTTEDRSPDRSVFVKTSSFVKTTEGGSPDRSVFVNTSPFVNSAVVAAATKAKTATKGGQVCEL